MKRYLDEGMLVRSEYFRFIRYTLISLITLSVVFCPPLLADEQKDQTSIPFSFSLSQAVASSKKSGKPMVMVFQAVWCPHCREMKKTTLKDPEVIRVAQKFEWVSIDIDRDISLANSYEVTAVPQFLIFDPESNLRARIIGKTETAEFRQHLFDISDQIKKTEGQPVGQAPTLIEGGESTQIFSSPETYRAKAICFSKVGYGPLDLPSQSPLQALRLGIAPRTPSTLSRNQTEVWLKATWVNIWANEVPDYFFDYEQLQTNLGFAYGITDAVQFDVALQSRSRFGGVMDSFIQDFHDAFNIDQDGRDEVPKNDFRFNIAPSANHPGVSLTDSDRGIYAVSLLFTLQHNVTCGTEWMPAFAYAFTLQTELESDDLEGGSPFDFAAMVTASERFGNFYLYGTLGYTLFGRQEFRGIELRDSQFSGLLAIEWKAWTRASLLFQYLFTEEVADKLDDLSDPSHEITFGAKWEIANGTVLEFGLVENVIALSNSPDFGIHAGITTRF
jgi:thiol-disulfide isomerase/thioredoxin